MPQAVLDTHAEVRKLQKAGCPETQAAATVDLVSRAPVNPHIAQSLERLESRVERLDSRVEGLDSRVEGLDSRLERLDSRVERLDSRVGHIEDNMATKANLESLRADMIERIEAMRADMVRMIWIQSLAFATLAISLAGIMLGVAA